MIRFDYPPRVVPIAMARQDDRETFAQMCRDHHDWLCEQGITFQPTCYYWPEMLTSILLRTPIGKTVCEIRVAIAPEQADRFSSFSELQSFVDA